MLHGTIVLGIFSIDFGGKVLSHYNFSVKRYLWCTLLIRENCCSGVNKLHMEIVFIIFFCVACKTASMRLPVDMAFHPFLFLSVILSLPYGPSLLTLLHECESSCVLVHFNGSDSFVLFWHRIVLVF